MHNGSERGGAVLSRGKLDAGKPCGEPELNFFFIPGGAYQSEVRHLPALVNESDRQDQALLGTRGHQDGWIRFTHRGADRGRVRGVEGHDAAECRTVEHNAVIYLLLRSSIECIVAPRVGRSCLVPQLRRAEVGGRVAKRNLRLGEDRTHTLAVCLEDGDVGAAIFLRDGFYSHASGVRLEGKPAMHPHFVECGDSPP